MNIWKINKYCMPITLNNPAFEACFLNKKYTLSIQIRMIEIENK